MNISFNNKSLAEAYELLKDLKARRLDVIIPANTIGFKNRGGVFNVEGNGIYVNMRTTNAADVQLCSRIQMPHTYFSYLNTNTHEEYHDLLDTNLNTLLRYQEGMWFVRCYLDEIGGKSGIIRAFLTNKYFPIENLDILMIAIQAVKNACDRGINLEIGKLSLSETNFYCEFTAPDLKVEATNLLRGYKHPVTNNEGVSVISGFMMKNSETGHGQFYVAPLIQIEVCSNRMVLQKEASKKRHLGARMDEGVYSEKTQELNSQLIISQIEDVIGTFTGPDYLLKTIDELELLKEKVILDPMAYMTGALSALKINEEDSAKALEYFMNQGSARNQWDVVQAITLAAQDMDPDQRFEIESNVLNIDSLILEDKNKAKRGRKKKS